MLHQIGSGSSGPVFRAYQPELDRLVAVKMFRVELPPGGGEKLVAELEKLVAADLSHPGIAAPLGAGLVGDSAYLAQDFVAADSLDLSVQQYGAAPFEDAVRVAAQVAAALDFAAAIHVVHGALHPRDVLVSLDDTRLTGLGVVQAFDAAGAAVTLHPPYTAPERAAGEPWDWRADIFSLAAVVYELLWGTPIRGTLTETVASITPVPGADTEQLRAVFSQALADRPADRFYTAIAFASALERCADPATAAPGVVDDADDDDQFDLEADDSSDPGERVAPATGARQLPFLDRMTSRADEVPTGSDLRLSLGDRDQADEAEPEQPEPRGETEGPAVRVPAVRQVVQGGGADRFDDDIPDFDLRDADVGAQRREQGATIPVVLAPRGDPERPAAPVAATAAGAVSTPVSSGPGYSGAAARFSEYAAERSRSALWPLVLALIVGLAVGSAATFLLMNRDRGAGEGAAIEADAAPAAEMPAATGPAPSDPAAAASPPRIEAAGIQGSSSPPAGVETPLRAEGPRPSAGGDASIPRPPRTSAGDSTAGRAASAAAAAPRLSIRSTPAGARVLVDGRNVGVTPLTVRDLEPGRYAIRVVRDGYTSVDRSVLLTKGRPSQSIAVRLARTPVRAAGTTPAPSTPASLGRSVGTLLVQSRPSGANVMVDGKMVGTTPLQLDNVEAGPHVVTLELDGYGKWSASVRVAAGVRRTVSASLER